MSPLARNIIRGVQFAFAVVVLGTVGYFLSQYTGSYCGYWACYSQGVSGQAGFIIFDAVWTILATPYLALTPIFLPRLAHPIVIAIIDGITMLFWLAGAIALAVYTGVGSGDDWYSSLQSGVAFSFFLWASFLVTFVLSILAVTKGGLRRNKEGNNANPELQQGTVV